MLLHSCFAFSQMTEQQTRVVNAINKVDNDIENNSKIVGTRGDKDKISRSSRIALKKEVWVGNSAFVSPTKPHGVIFVGPQQCASDEVGAMDTTTSSTHSSNTDQAMLVMMQATTKDDADKHRKAKVNDKRRQKSDRTKRGSNKNNSIHFNPSRDLKSDLCGIEITLAPKITSTRQANEGLESSKPEQCTNDDGVANTVSGIAEGEKCLPTTADDGAFVLLLPIAPAKKHEQTRRRAKNVLQHADKQGDSAQDLHDLILNIKAEKKQQIKSTKRALTLSELLEGPGNGSFSNGNSISGLTESWNDNCREQGTSVDKYALPPTVRRDGLRKQLTSIRSLLSREEENILPPQQRMDGIRKQRRSSISYLPPREEVVLSQDLLNTLREQRSGIFQSMILGDSEELLPPQVRKGGGQRPQHSSIRNLLQGEAKVVLPTKEERKDAKQTQRRSSLGKERKAPNKTCRSLGNNREPPPIKRKVNASSYLPSSQFAREPS
jgi:hypothetical protein